MVADALVTKQEVGVFSYDLNIKNFTGHEKDIVSAIKTISRIDWMRNQTGSFREIFDVPFSEILTSRGYGFSFNIMEARDLLNINQ